MKRWVCLLLFAVSGAAHAQADDLCARAPDAFQSLAYAPESRLSLENQGGIAGGGVCWWHSRLQRAAIYLATFRPGEPKPSYGQALGIIRSLVNRSRVVAIPGYASFAEFSRDYEREILRNLERWQRIDGVLGFRWVDGLMGRHWTSSRKLRLIMERIHDRVAVRHEILFEKLALRGIISHAYLVIGSRKTDDGYEMDVIDSNHPQETLTVTYTSGERSLHMPDGGLAFVPYLDFQEDMRPIQGALRRFCQRQVPQG
jgi:hypothetical protein